MALLGKWFLMQARAVLIDMEEGVINQLLKVGTFLFFLDVSLKPIYE